MFSEPCIRSSTQVNTVVPQQQLRQCWTKSIRTLSISHTWTHTRFMCLMFILVLCYTDFVFCCAKQGIWCSCVCASGGAQTLCSVSAWLNFVHIAPSSMMPTMHAIYENDQFDRMKLDCWRRKKKEGEDHDLNPPLSCCMPFVCMSVRVVVTYSLLGGTHAPFRGRSFGTAPLNEWLADATTSGTPKFDQAYMCVFSGSINRRRPALSGCPMIFGSIIRTQYIMCYRVYLANCLWHRILIALGDCA